MVTRANHALVISRQGDIPEVPLGDEKEWEEL
jgi:hypothetical protein